MDSLQSAIVYQNFHEDDILTMVLCCVDYVMSLSRHCDLPLWWDAVVCKPSFLSSPWQRGWNWPIWFCSYKDKRWKRKTPWPISALFP